MGWTPATWVGEPTSFLFPLLYHSPYMSLGGQGMEKAGKPSISQEGQGILPPSHAARLPHSRGPDPQGVMENHSILGQTDRLRPEVSEAKG